MKKPIVSPLTPDQVVKNALKHIHQQAFRYGLDALTYAANYGNLYEHLNTNHAGMRLPPSVRLSEAVLFEWRRQVSKDDPHQEIVIFTPTKVLQKVVTWYKTSRGAFSVATLREVSIEEVLSYARTCPQFVTHVARCMSVMCSRIKKYRTLSHVR